MSLGLLMGRGFLLLVLFLFFFSPSLMGETGTYVEVEGVGHISGGNLVQARDTAITDALRNAVEQAVGLVLDSQTRVQNYQLIEDSILTRTQGYVSEYQLLESWTSQGMFFVRLGVVVKERILQDDLAALDLIIQRAGDPRVMVIIPEEHLRRAIPDPAAETEIIRQLLEAGFRLVDQGQVTRVRESEVLRQALAGDEEAYQRLGAEYDADLLVIGEAFSELVGTYHGFFSCRARVEVRVVRTDTGEILAAHGIHESGVDITESAASKKSLAEAGATMAGYLISVLPASLADSSRSVQLVLQGVTFMEVQEFFGDLQGMHLVEDVFLRDFTGEGARFDLNTALLPMQLAQEILTLVQLPLEVTGISGSKVELKKE